MSKQNNTGYDNTGNYNAGSCNAGHYNTGNGNTGSSNTGNRNAGNRNTGHYNTGNGNTGNGNTGNGNAGSCNAGHWNTGGYNAGSYNAGNWNAGNWNAGHFNIDQPKTVRVFGKEVPRDEFDQWDQPDWLYFAPGDNYKESFQDSYNAATREEQLRIKECPGFDADIFYELSGIRVDVEEMTLEDVCKELGRNIRIV